MHENYMQQALELAKRGKGKVNPNPLVGAIIVKKDRIIGQGYHEEYGKAHAEVNAINSVDESLKGATMYVTLEPCSHYGKTPPCVDRIIDSGILKVVVGTLDPNPLVSGRGIKKLKDAGIEVITGVLEDECIKINEVFMKYVVNKKPFVVLKTAMSLDGKIATVKGESKWITGEGSRRDVHKLRNEMMAIMVGVNTVIVDNPELTCRLDNGRNPVRIIVDSKLRVPIDSKVVTDSNKSKTIVATTELANKDRINRLKAMGITVLITKAKNDRVDLHELMISLGELNIDGILLEGGATLSYSALQERIVDKIQVYIAPKILGGEKAKTPVGGNGIELLKEAFKVRDMSSRFVDRDILIEGYIDK